jgi:hypothetical protein
MIGALLKELALLPVAPVRFTVWVAEKVDDQASAERYSQAAVVQQLREIARARREGRISDEEAAEAEAEIIEGHAVEQPARGPDAGGRDVGGRDVGGPDGGGEEEGAEDG